MLIKQSQTSFGFKFLKEIPITRMWANDGWCYIPEMKRRDRFFEAENGFMNVQNEHYDGIIPFPEHSELLTYYLCSESPLVWVEKAPWGCQLYEQIHANHSK